MRRLTPVVAAALIGATFLISGCALDDPQWNDEPVLLIQITDSGADSGQSGIYNLTLRQTSPTAQTVVVSSFLGFTGKNHEGDPAGGYTYTLEEGASYDQLTYEDSSGMSYPRLFQIDAAEPEMVYVFHIGF